MSEKKFPCLRCKKMKGKEVFLVEKHDMLVCPECNTSFFVEGKSPLGRYAENWQRNAQDVFPLLRPPLYPTELEPRFFFLYDDCYQTLLIGKHNASIVLMGVLLETVMKERIWLKLGIDFRQAYGRCLRKIEQERLMDPKDIYFLKKFKDSIRNPYTHADESQILEGILVPVFPLKLGKDFTLEEFEESFKKARSGKVKPKLVPASDVPAIRSVVKQEYDRRRAKDLFNQVYDFLLSAKIKYFKPEEYEEHHKKFGPGLEKI